MNKAKADSTLLIGSARWRKLVSKGGAEVSVELTPTMVNQLAVHGEQLLKWNRRINLTAITDPMDVAVKHFIDSLSILPYLSDSKKVLDIGAGGGFPGIPLAVVSPRLEVTMVDAVTKKVSFLKAVIRELALPNCRAHHFRVAATPNDDEKIAARSLGRFDTIVSRALADPELCLRLAISHLAPNGSILMMQGHVAHGVTSALAVLCRKLRPESDVQVEIHPIHLPFLRTTRHLIVMQLQVNRL